MAGSIAWAVSVSRITGCLQWVVGVGQVALSRLLPTLTDSTSPATSQTTTRAVASMAPSRHMRRRSCHYEYYSTAITEGAGCIRNPRIPVGIQASSIFLSCIHTQHANTTPTPNPHSGLPVWPMRWRRRGIKRPSWSPQQYEPRHRGHDAWRTGHDYARLPACCLTSAIYGHDQYAYGY